MKKIMFFSLMLSALLISITSCAQDDKSKRPSPPDTLSATINGANVVIDYSKPALNGRTVGKQVATYGEVWRTGANEATTFTVDKDVKIEGQALKAGKYALFTIPGQDEWTIIFNKQPNQWGAFKYEQAQDALRVKVKPTKASNVTERMTFSNDNNKINLAWGDTMVSFNVE